MRQHYPLDRVVFGVAAGLMVAFIAWGVLGTTSLSAVATSGAGRGHHRRRLGVRAGRERLRRLRAVARDQQVRQHPARPRRRGAGVPDRLVDRDDVQRRHGHRPDVLRRRRAAHALRHAAARAPARRATPRPFRRGDGHHAVPLDAAPVGDLRRRRPRHRLRHLPQGPPAADQLGVRPAVRPASAPRAPFGKVIDILAIFATLFGSAASLGLGALQIGCGLRSSAASDNVGTSAARRASSSC